MKKPFELAYGFKSHCTSITERLSKLEDCLWYRRKKQRNIFPPFVNELLPPLINISLKGLPILYPLKQNYLCDYNRRCLKSIGLMFDGIIINILSNKKLEFQNEEVFFNTYLEQQHSYVQGITSGLLLE